MFYFSPSGFQIPPHRCTLTEYCPCISCIPIVLYISAGEPGSGYFPETAGTGTSTTVGCCSAGLCPKPLSPPRAAIFFHLLTLNEMLLSLCGEINGSNRG